MSFVHHYEKNIVGRDFATGDIHGCFKKLRTELENIGFDPERDRLFSVGDLVDCGPDSDLALEFLEKHWFHAVRGNHEDLAIQYAGGDMIPSYYVENGGAWNVSNPRDLQVKFADAFACLPIAIEVETDNGLIGIVHADCPFPTWRDFTVSLDDPNVSGKMRDAMFEAAMWSRERIQIEDHTGIPDVRAVIVGHTPLKRPVALGNVYHIDTGAVFRNGYFTFINLATLETLPPMPKKLEWEEA
ncbi:metallophosphoesterase [Paraburkholderia tropica]|uniref:metallophosphoesterase n=1 Tax=Paraburkholderia tropica TaxID=92647 RepID=UPI002AB69CEA|nr:metallophosphoesterase [Paraburkholderia tropica]